MKSEEYIAAHEKLAALVVEAYDVGWESREPWDARCSGVIQQALERANDPGMVVWLALAAIEERFTDGDS